MKSMCTSVEKSVFMYLVVQICQYYGLNISFRYSLLQKHMKTKSYDNVQGNKMSSWGLSPLLHYGFMRSTRCFESTGSLA